MVDQIFAERRPAAPLEARLVQYRQQLPVQEIPPYAAFLWSWIWRPIMPGQQRKPSMSISTELPLKWNIHND